MVQEEVRRDVRVWQSMAAAGHGVGSALEDALQEEEGDGRGAGSESVDSLDELMDGNEGGQVAIHDSYEKGEGSESVDSLDELMDGADEGNGMEEILSLVTAMSAHVIIDECIEAMGCAVSNESDSHAESYRWVHLRSGCDALAGAPGSSLHDGEDGEEGSWRRDDVCGGMEAGVESSDTHSSCRATACAAEASHAGWYACAETSDEEHAAL